MFKHYQLERITRPYAGSIVQVEKRDSQQSMAEQMTDELR